MLGLDSFNSIVNLVVFNKQCISSILNREINQQWIMCINIKSLTYGVQNPSSVIQAATD